MLALIPYAEKVMSLKGLAEKVEESCKKGVVHECQHR
jgi:hypothetical protein